MPLPGNAKPHERLSYQVALLPFLEQDALHRKISTDHGFFDSQNQLAAKTVIRVALCPNHFVDAKNRESVPPFTSYVAMAGLGNGAATLPTNSPGIGFLGYDRTTHFSDFPNGTSNVIAMIETDVELGSWMQAGPSTLRSFDPESKYPLGNPYGIETKKRGHSGGFAVLIVDGSIRPFRYDALPPNFATAMTLEGGDFDKVP
jgi:hypothetical protein